MTKYLTNNFNITNLYKKPSTKSEIVTQMIYGDSFSISKRNKKYIPIIHAVMKETNLSMADTIFQTMKEKHDEIESKKLHRQLLGV